MGLQRRLIRIVLTPLQGLRRLLWLVTGPGKDGVHAVALTPRGAVVLVRLTYARGWRLPGGGRKRNESALEGTLRELQEEIGLLSHGEIERLETIQLRDLPGGRSELFLVRDVAYRPRRSLEIEDVREFDPADLPGDVSETTRTVLETLALPALRGAKGP